MVLQTDGKILVGGFFTSLAGQPRSRIARLNPDGSLDTTFNADADNAVWSLAMQADGKILVGGGFSTLTGQPRNRIGRLTSGSAALQSLSVEASGTTVAWSRSGSGPEIGQITFEQSTDSANYMMLGAGTRINGRWQINELSLPIGKIFCVRARGRATGGRSNGSSSVIESVAQFYQLSAPYLAAPRLVDNGSFQLVFSNPDAASFIVLAATNVALPSPDWHALGPAVTVGGGFYQFTDPDAVNHPRRFYQLRTP